MPLPDNLAAIRSGQRVAAQSQHIHAAAAHVDTGATYTDIYTDSNAHTDVIAYTCTYTYDNPHTRTNAYTYPCTNPHTCADCNTFLKFGLVWDLVESRLGIRHLATGHEVAC